MSEHVDEFLFTNPTNAFLNVLNANNKQATLNYLNALHTQGVPTNQDVLTAAAPWDPMDNPLVKGAWRSEKTSIWTPKLRAEENADLDMLEKARAEIKKKTDALRRRLHTQEQA